MIGEELCADPLFREMLDDERQEGLQEGRLEGAIQTAQEIAIRLVAKRFPELEEFARIVIAAVSDVERLQVLAIELSVVSSQDQARELLFSLASDS
jgi:predicted transposase YdaD